MDFGAAFSFVTADEEWVKKLAIAAVLALASLLTFGLALIPLAGWALAISRRVSQGTEPVLPEWTEFGGYVMDGLKMVAIGFVWAIPLLLLSACAWGVNLLVAGQGDSETISTIVSIVGSCISIPYGILLALLEPAAFGHLAHSDNLGQAINPLNAFKILRENIGAYVIIALVWLLLVPIIQSIGLLVCIIGVFPAIAYTMALVGHLMGQAYRGSMEAGFTLGAS